MAGFPWTHEEDSTILVFVLRRIGSRGEARRWPLVLGWVMGDGPRSPMYVTKGDPTILQSAVYRQARWTKKLHDRRLALVLITTHELPDKRSRCERAARHHILGASTHAG